MIVDTARPKIKNCMDLLSDKRFTDIINANSQMDTGHIEFIIKGLEYMLGVYTHELKRGKDTPFLVNINARED